jgi:hypothetical protein
VVLHHNTNIIVFHLLALSDGAIFSFQDKSWKFNKYISKYFSMPLGIRQLASFPEYLAKALSTVGRYDAVN